MPDKRHKSRAAHKQFLVNAFTAVSSAVLTAGALYLNEIKTGVDEHNARLDKIDSLFAENIEDVCIRSDNFQPVRRQSYRQALFPSDDKNSPAVPAPAQILMRNIIEKMEHTAIGTALNESARQHNVIWCGAGEKSGIFYGRYMGYSANVAIVNLGEHGGIDRINENRQHFHRALRTAYEESAHAWQNNEHDALRAPYDSKERHAIAWSLATEAAAKAFTYAALYQHKQNGEDAVWRDNKTRYESLIMMQALESEIQEAQEQNITMNVLWRCFDSFYDMESTVRVYQAHYGQNDRYRTGRLPIATEHFEMRIGSVPGMTGNYLSGRNISPDIDRYGKDRRRTAATATSSTSPPPLPLPQIP